MRLLPQMFKLLSAPSGIDPLDLRTKGDSHRAERHSRECSSKQDVCVAARTARFPRRGDIQFVTSMHSSHLVVAVAALLLSVASRREGDACLRL